jgi:hypothetical protein
MPIVWITILVVLRNKVIQMDDFIPKFCGQSDVGKNKAPAVDTAGADEGKPSSLF